MISIIDCGIGNLRSVEKALEYIGFESIVTSKKDTILESNGIILPGVGAFPDAMESLSSTGLDAVLKEAAENNIPILGICLGMQLLFDESDEIKPTKGLGLIPGKVKKITGDVKIPHMGWNSLMFKNDSILFKNIKENSYVYFVHSFYAQVQNEENLLSECSYDINITAAVSKGNVYGTQFHPEKSGDVGIQILRNFGELIK